MPIARGRCFQTQATAWLDDLPSNAYFHVFSCFPHRFTEHYTYSLCLTHLFPASFCTITRLPSPPKICRICRQCTFLGIRRRCSLKYDETIGIQKNGWSCHIETNKLPLLLFYLVCLISHLTLWNVVIPVKVKLCIINETVLTIDLV